MQYFEGNHYQTGEYDFQNEQFKDWNMNELKDFHLPHRHGEIDNIDKVADVLQNVSHFAGVADIFRQLGDPTRVRIFWLLNHYELCVINIAALLGMSSPAVSHHLKSLNECGLICSRRDGKEVYYKASDNEESRLLHIVVEKIMEITCPKEAVDYGASSKEIVHGIHKYMLEHMSERITIEKLARKYLMNTTTLKKVFKEEYGTSIALHMKEHRMEAAASMLTDTDKSIAEIAALVGYESQSRFTSAFKSQYKLVPSEYRRTKQKSSKIHE